MSPRDDEYAEDEAAITEQEQQEQQHQRRRQERKRKLRLFDASGLTEADRRETRKHQRAVNHQLREDVCGDIDKLEDVRESNNKIFKEEVRFTREAVLDADNVDLIASQYAQQMEKQVQVPRFDAKKLVQKLTQKCTVKTDQDSSGYFDWKGLGVECGICFNAVPDRVTFLAGALDQEVVVKKRKERKKREKAVDDNAEEITPEEVKNNKGGGDADKLSAMEKNMRVIRKKLDHRTAEETANNNKNDGGGGGSKSQHPGIDAVQFLVNPKSFTQTVENIFNFSFLIKKGEAEIGVNDDVGLYVAKRALDPEQSPNPTQAVCSFTMADWRKLCQAYDLKEGDLPHRTGSKHSRATSKAASSQE